MYTVLMEHECACFVKSEYTNNNTFKTQREAYSYAKTVAELMNDEFCGKHTFESEIAQDNCFVIRVALNAKAASGCSTGVTCDVGCDSTDDWALENTETEGCGSGCGCA
ncbi:hypothetical protein JHD46_02720 [Sulfurimonas sp. SAG-AH-194-C20]|nr:hypothetical protein [Sulfurimonas sp. SAG-AH-194-C20]MDF1878550.1 hypothetical protein [Sulfurimonas sp. SAG-AH-194-C20]